MDGGMRALGLRHRACCQGQQHVHSKSTRYLTEMLQTLLEAGCQGGRMTPEFTAREGKDKWQFAGIACGSNWKKQLQ